MEVTALKAEFLYNIRITEILFAVFVGFVECLCERKSSFDKIIANIFDKKLVSS